MSRAATGAVFFLALTAAGPALGAYRAEIVRTAYGVPHVTAPDFGGLGYGQAYAFAQDNFCLVANGVVTVNGERSLHFGPDAATVSPASSRAVNNFDSDVYYRSIRDLPYVRATFGRTGKDFQALVRGAVAGFNRYLRDTPRDRLPEACRNASWVRPVTLDDILLIQQDRALQPGMSAQLAAIATAAPATRAAAGETGVRLASAADWEEEGLGSNGWAFGRDATGNGRGLLVGNPHYPWESLNRFYQVHLTVPGKLDVMGAGSGVGIGLTIGFNKDVAWTHTVSTDAHYTLFALQLDPADPTAYLVDGRRHTMTRKVISVPVKDENQPRTRTLYGTIYGLVLATELTPWTAQRAYAIRDANLGNMRTEGWLSMARARSVREIRDEISRHLGMPFINTIAADRHGEALYADITSAPNVSAAKLAACAPNGATANPAPGVFVLDGSRAACNWDVAAGTPRPGLMPASGFPSVIRTDYVANSNDSYWLASPRAPLPAVSPIIGPYSAPQSLRTRAGIHTIERRLTGQDGRSGDRVDADSVLAMLYENRDYAAELVLDDLLALCRLKRAGQATSGATVDLTEACRVLARWDRRVDTTSVGAVLFREFWARASTVSGLWRTPFDPADPANTPRGLNTSGETGARLLTALADALQLMAAQKLAIAAPYGEQHFAVRNGVHIPVHGGVGADGILNMQQSRFVAAVGGYVPFHGTSYLQIVSFDERGPVAKGILTYSQSTNPASPHFGDQTAVHARKMLYDLPFHREDVTAQAAGPALRIAE